MNAKGAGVRRGGHRWVHRMWAVTRPQVMLECIRHAQVHTRAVHTRLLTHSSQTTAQSRVCQLCPPAARTRNHTHTKITHALTLPRNARNTLTLYTQVLRDRIKSGASKPINFATVVTDFTTCHNTWFCPGATRCFVPTEYCRDLAISNEMDPRQIIMHGEKGRWEGEGEGGREGGMGGGRNGGRGGRGRGERGEGGIWGGGREGWGEGERDGAVGEGGERGRVNPGDEGGDGMGERGGKKGPVKNG